MKKVTYILFSLIIIGFINGCGGSNTVKEVNQDDKKTLPASHVTTRESEDILPTDNIILSDKTASPDKNVDSSNITPDDNIISKDNTTSPDKDVDSSNITPDN